MNKEKKRCHGKYVVMLGSDWHVAGLEGICYNTRVDAFVLSCLRILKKLDVPAQAVPFEEIFAEWRKVHIEMLKVCYGSSVETAELKTDSWLTTIQVVGQGIREFISACTFEDPEELIFRKGTKTHFIVAGVELATAHLRAYNGSPRSESRHLFFGDSFINAFYKKAMERVK